MTAWPIHVKVEEIWRTLLGFHSKAATWKTVNQGEKEMGWLLGKKRGNVGLQSSFEAIWDRLDVQESGRHVLPSRMFIPGSS